MTKRNLAGLFAGFLALTLLAGQTASQPAADKHHRGRVTPKNLFHLKELSLVRNGAETKALPPATMPDYDSRTLGIVPPVKNQGQCGSCWDFSGIGVVEIAYCKAGLADAKAFNLSEQYILSCQQNGGCNGDDNTTVLKVAKATGIPLTADYGPYQAREGQCRFNQSMKLPKITDWGFANGDSGYETVTPTQDIKNCILAYGSVGCAVAANSSWDGYSGGVHHGNSRQIDHDVILVGWHDDPALKEGGYWIMRNSWGPEWGDQGYMKIAYGADSIGTEAVFAYVTNPNPPPPPPGPVVGGHRMLWVVVLGGTLGVVLIVAVVVLVRKYKVVAR